jgi:hypothetical protein
VPTNGFPWDAYHVNSIDVTRQRHVPRLDARHLGRLSREHQDRARSSGRSAAATRASRSAPNAEFQWQHDVKLQPGGEVTMFDDHCCQLTGGGTYVAGDRQLARRSC